VDTMPLFQGERRVLFYSINLNGIGAEISCLFTVQKGSKKHITRPNYSIPGTIFSRIDFLESQTSILLQDMVRFNGDRFIT
jgi:hypothetical protein